MIFEITINIYNGFKKIYTVFLYFIRFFKKNRIKIFLKITINFYNGFYEKFIRFCFYFIRFFQKTV